MYRVLVRADGVYLHSRNVYVIPLGVEYRIYVTCGDDMCEVDVMINNLTQTVRLLPREIRAVGGGCIRMNPKCVYVDVDDADVIPSSSRVVELLESGQTSVVSATFRFPNGRKPLSISATLVPAI